MGTVHEAQAPKPDPKVQQPKGLTSFTSADCILVLTMSLEWVTQKLGWLLAIGGCLLLCYGSAYVLYYWCWGSGVGRMSCGAVRLAKYPLMAGIGSLCGAGYSAGKLVGVIDDRRRLYAAPTIHERRQLDDSVASPEIVACAILLFVGVWAY